MVMGGGWAKCIEGGGDDVYIDSVAIIICITLRLSGNSERPA